MWHHYDIIIRQNVKKHTQKAKFVDERPNLTGQIQKFLSMIG